MGRFCLVSRFFSPSYLVYFTRPATYVLLLFGLAMGLSFLSFPGAVAGADDLDPAWQQAYAYLFLHNFQAGKDYIFTCGPLGVFYGSTYDSEVFWYKYGWELAVSFVFVIVILKFVSYLPGMFTKLLFCLVIAVFAGWMEFPLCIILLAGIVAIRDNKPSCLWPIAVSLILAVLSLVKFPFFLFSIVVLLCLFLDMVGKKRLRMGIVLLALFCAELLLLWLGLGQSLFNIPRYVFGSMQMTAGYAEGMAVEGKPNELYLAGLILVCLGAALLPFSTRKWPATKRRLFGLRHLSRLGILGAAIFLEWKHGFVRHDGHAVSFFSFMLVTPFLLPVLFPAYDWRAALRILPTVACFILSLIGFTMVTNDFWTTHFPSLPDSLIKKGRIALDPSTFRSDLDSQTIARAEEAPLPLIKARVGGASVDIISYEQAILFLNKMNWRPRPVFQSHGAYTPYLLSLNDQFFRSERAPEYLIFRFQAIDGRFPTSEEGPALLAILWRYQPVLVENNYLLLERVKDQRANEIPAGKLVLEKTVRLGEKVDLDGLPGRYHTLSVRMKPSWRGRLRKFLFKPPVVNIQVSTPSDTEAQTYRLIPAMAESGFLLSPLLGSRDDIINLYDSDDAGANVVTSFSISCSNPECYEDQIALTIKSLPRLVGRKVDPADLNKCRYPMMKTLFSRAEAREPLSVQTYDKKDVLVACAPSEIEFQIPARARWHRIVGKFGILPMGYEDPKEHTEGVQFAVEYTAAGGDPRVLFQQFLDPFTNQEDQGMKEFQVWLPPGGEGRVLLRASNPPDKDDLFGWSFWTDFEIEGVHPDSKDQPETGGTDEPPPTEVAVQELEKLGAKIERDNTQPSRPVIRLDLTDTAIGNPGVKELVVLEQLQSLNLQGTKITDAGLKELAPLQQLQWLGLQGTKITDAGLKELALLRQLSGLDLAGTSISDASLKELVALEQLQGLDLGGTPITDAGLKELTALKNLRWLNLGGTKVGNGGLKSVAQLAQLNYLDLRNTGVTDTSLKELAVLKQLENLYLGGTKVSEAEVKELQKTLPKCTIHLGLSPKD